MENEEIKKKDITKEKIILFVIGVLVGAVISTGAFFAYIKLAGVGNSGQSMQMPSGTPPEMPNGEQGGTPPEMPNNEDGQSTTPPEKPSDENDSSSTEKQNEQSGTSSSKSNKNRKLNSAKS